jgi:hypothetical protein
MRLALTVAFAAATLSAAGVRGVVVDNQTGRPLARATVVAQPIAGTSGAPRSAKSAPDGAFAISGLSDGAWLVIGSRPGFAPTQMVARPTESGSALSLRMRRFGVITGTVLDENDVGLQEHDVVAYRDARPLVIAARARTDDRGVYRLEGLEPGAYLVRTVGREYDEGSYLSTFAREALRLTEARPVIVRYDDEIPLVDLRPVPSRLFVVTGRVYGKTPAVVTLVSDAGPQTATTGPDGVFRFPPSAPGRYEIYAQTRTEAAWSQFELYAGSGSLHLTLAPHPEVRLSVEDTGGKPVEPANIPILLRRRDLAGEGLPEIFGGASRVLAPGRWELSLAPTPSWYAVQPSVWSETVVTAPGPVTANLVLSNRPATIRGVVRDAGREPVAGVPVYLGDGRATRTDVRGQFEFYGLAPGPHRVLATFDQMHAGANAVALTIEEGQDRSIDLDLYVAR